MTFWCTMFCLFRKVRCIMLVWQTSELKKSGNWQQKKFLFYFFFLSICPTYGENLKRIWDYSNHICRFHKESLCNIHENKFLQTSDYLISCRGKTIGYSLKKHEHNEHNQIIHKGSCILPTHHFLVLRPRSASLQDIEYLHFVLDMYVEHVLSVEKNNKNILSKGDIESREIKMIYNQVKQEEFVKILKGLKEEARLVQDKISFHLRNYTDTMDSNTH